MRSWPVPVQIAGEEKVFGGILSLRQLGWLVAGIGLGIAVAVVAPVPLLWRFVFFSFFALIGFLLCFVRVINLSADVALWRLNQWWRRERKLTLK